MKLLEAAKNAEGKMITNQVSGKQVSVRNGCLKAHHSITLAEYDEDTWEIDVMPQSVHAIASDLKTLANVYMTAESSDALISLEKDKNLSWFYATIKGYTYKVVVTGVGPGEVDY